MDKFCLKWNEFHTNSSKSFQDLRGDQNFVDVTLVGDDGHHITAHKIVLSSSSDFFKDNLLKVEHPKPMIYLSGFDSKILNLIIDYIYEGEAKLFQEDIDTFIDCSRKLKIKGLMESHEENQNGSKHEIDSINLNFKEEHIFDEKPLNELAFDSATTRKYSKTVNVALHDDEAKKQIEDLIIKSDHCDDGWICKICGKYTTLKSNMKKHVEIHVNGLSYQCNICSNTYNTKMSLNNHRKSHK